MEAASMDASRKTVSNIEFLEFLADISHPATGEISPARLANWLCQTEADLNEKWRIRGAGIPWAIFADELLAVLDAAQDHFCDLDAVIEWYLDEPISNFGMNTPQQLVVGGRARQLVLSIKTKEVSFP
jgi:hypothetical protein